MTLGDKLRYLREMEGTLRGLDRPMSQSEVSRSISEELGQPISQAYLSQVENGRRKHLTETTRMLLARFFKVHPGYLVTDPEGFHTELMSPVPVEEASLDLWLVDGAERFAQDPEIRAALLAIARNEDTRKCILVLGALAKMPEMVDRLRDALMPGSPNGRIRKGRKQK